jgi:hypothetical protein
VLIGIYFISYFLNKSKLGSKAWQKVIFGI